MKIFFKKITTFSLLAKLYFKVMNILCFIVDDSSAYYCFFEKYNSVELNYNRGRQSRALCRVQTEFSNFEERLDKNQFNEVFLKDYLQKLIPYLIEFYVVDQKLIKVFFLANTSILVEIGTQDKNSLLCCRNRSDIKMFF